MKAIQFTAPETIIYGEVPTPEIKDNEILTTVEYVGFCATDMELLEGQMLHIKNGLQTYPMIPGHEWCGKVVAVGKDVKGFKVGDIVTSDSAISCGVCENCRTGHYNLCPERGCVGAYRNRQGVFAQFVTTPERHLYKFPDGVDLQEAALVEPAATALYGVKRARIEPGQAVMVIGDGPIGQLAAQMANLNGASKVIMVGSWDEKLAIAKECGVSDTINYHKEDVVARAQEIIPGGPEIIIETSGNNAALDMAVRSLRPTGRIVCISWYTGPSVDIAMNTVIVKDAEIIGTLGQLNCFAPTIRYFAEGKLKLRPLITHVFPMDQFEDVVKLVRAKKEMRIKILLKP